jgi:hypothetical protein
MRELSTTRPRNKGAATLLLAAAAAAAIVAVRQMNGMDMGVATGLGSFTLTRRRLRPVGRTRPQLKGETP